MSRMKSYKKAERIHDGVNKKHSRFWIYVLIYSVLILSFVYSLAMGLFTSIDITTAYFKIHSATPFDNIFDTGKSTAMFVVLLVIFASATMLIDVDALKLLYVAWPISKQQHNLKTFVGVNAGENWDETKKRFSLINNAKNGIAWPLVQLAGWLITSVSIWFGFYNSVFAGHGEAVKIGGSIACWFAVTAIYLVSTFYISCLSSVVNKSIKEFKERNHELRIKHYELKSQIKEKKRIDKKGVNVNRW